MNKKLVTLKYALQPGWNKITTHGSLQQPNTHVAAQGNNICLWVSCDKGHEEREHHLYVALTGEVVPEPVDPSLEMFYLGTCLQNGGGFVTHAYLQI